MVEEYGLEGYDTETALKVGAIRYELTRLMFSIENPVTIADDVSDETVATIKEDKQDYMGADVLPVAYREYADSTLAPHILGTVRKINAEEYAELKDEGYGINDNIGESGIEAAMESELRGTPGELNFDWAWIIAIFSSRVILPRASSTRSSIGFVSSRYTGVCAARGAAAISSPTIA